MGKVALEQLAKAKPMGNAGGLKPLLPLPSVFDIQTREIWGDFAGKDEESRQCRMQGCRNHVLFVTSRLE